MIDSVIYDISPFLYYNYIAFLKLLLCKTTEYFNKKKLIKLNSRMHIDIHIISVKFSFQFANMIISRIVTTHAKNTFRRFQSSNFRPEPCLCIDGECSPIEPFVQTLHLDILTTLFRIILFMSPKHF